MKNTHIVFFFYLLLIFVSCNRKSSEVTGQSGEEIGVPPSLTENSAEIETVNLSEKEIAELKIKTVKVKTQSNNYLIIAPGEAFPAPKRSSLISTPINGQISNISAFEGEMVKKGQELFQIQSLEFGTLISEYLQAQAEMSFQKNRYERLQELVKERISSKSELEKSISEFDRAKALIKSSVAKLKAVGVPEKELAQFNAENFDPSFKIYAPINGVVEKNFVELGQSVSAMENLSRILDTREMLIRGYVSPNESRYISVGDSVVILKRKQPDSMIRGIITSLNPGLDEETRSFVVNIIIPTQNGWPRVGENLRLEIQSSTPQQSLLIPVAALTYDGDKAVVFVKKSDAVFEKRIIEINELREQMVVVESGLANGEEIAVSNVFSLKALSRFDIISE